MNYVVGTGRCGTKTIAHLFSGVHEPRPRIISEANDFYLGNWASLGKLKRKLIARSKLSTTLISDHKQSLVIPLIAQLDATAHFVVLFRDPLESVASFLKRRWYRRASIWERNRLRPWQGFPNDWTQAMKCTWLWCETYRTILSSVSTCSFELIDTNELGQTILNASPASQAENLLSEKECELMEKHATPLFRSLRWIREQSADGPIASRLKEARVRENQPQREASDGLDVD